MPLHTFIIFNFCFENITVHRVQLTILPLLADLTKQRGSESRLILQERAIATVSWLFPNFFCFKGYISFCSLTQ